MLRTSDITIWLDGCEICPNSCIQSCLPSLQCLRPSVLCGFQYPRQGRNTRCILQQYIASLDLNRQLSRRKTYGISLTILFNNCLDIVYQPKVFMVYTFTRNCHQRNDVVQLVPPFVHQSVIDYGNVVSRREMKRKVQVDKLMQGDYFSSWTHRHKLRNIGKSVEELYIHIYLEFQCRHYEMRKLHLWRQPWKII